jgi:hypothetical protein
MEKNWEISDKVFNCRQVIDDGPIYPIAYRWVEGRSSHIDVLAVKTIVKTLRSIKDIVKLKWPIAKNIIELWDTLTTNKYGLHTTYF